MIPKLVPHFKSVHFWEKVNSVITFNNLARNAKKGKFFTHYGATYEFLKKVNFSLHFLWDHNS